MSQGRASGTQRNIMVSSYERTTTFFPVSPVQSASLQSRSSSIENAVRIKKAPQQIERLRSTCYGSGMYSPLQFGELDSAIRLVVSRPEGLDGPTKTPRQLT